VRPRRTVPFLSAALVTLALVVGCGGTNEVTTYCSYGAVSQAQLDGCEQHVTNYIDGLSTNASRYARGELNQCLADAGPYCVRR
jgi:hypothetical protein